MPSEQKRESDPLELELEVALKVSLYVCSELKLESST